MHGPDARHDADVRLGDLAELGDLTEAAHAHLDDGDLRVLLEPAEREREPDLVVLASRHDGGRGRQRAPRMSFVDVFAVEPVTATTFAAERSSGHGPAQGAPARPKAVGPT